MRLLDQAAAPDRRRLANDPGTAEHTGGALSPRGRRYLVSLAVVSVVVLAIFLYALGAQGQSTTASSSTSLSTTTYDVSASSVLSSAAGYAPAGYLQGSTKQLGTNESGLLSAGYGLYSTQGGALANLTVLVFDSPSSAQTYISSVISNAKGLSGYSNANSTLSGFQHYGVCYGYAEGDPEGGGYVANGLCTKGNVYIQVHLVSVSSLASAEGDMSGFVGAAYRGLG